MVKKVTAKTFLALVLAFLYLPIIWLIAFSFTSSISVNEWTDFTFEAYINLFTGPNSQEIFSALSNTMIIGVIASLFATIFGTLAAVGIHSMRRKSRAVYNTVSQIPMVNAEIVTAFSLMLLFVLCRTFLPITGELSIISVILAHISFCTPYVILNIMPRLKQMDMNVYEAALDLGATPFKAIMKVIVPEILPGIIMGFVLAFTLSIDDFVITQYNIDGIHTLSTYIYAKSGGKKSLPIEVRALSSLIFIVILGLLFAINVRKTKNKSKHKELVK